MRREAYIAVLPVPSPTTMPEVTSSAAHSAACCLYRSTTLSSTADIGPSLSQGVGELRRDLQRDPAIDTVGGRVDRAEQVRGDCDVLERQIEEQLLARLSCLTSPANLVVIVGGLADAWSRSWDWT